MVPQLHFSGHGVGFLFEPLDSFLAPFALHRRRPLPLHSPERFAAANLGGTASSTDARQPPGQQEPFRLLPGTQVLEVAETETSSTRTKWAAGGGRPPTRVRSTPQGGLDPLGAEFAPGM